MWWEGGKTNFNTFKIRILHLYCEMRGQQNSDVSMIEKVHVFFINNLVCFVSLIAKYHTITITFPGTKHSIT